ncbi:MAG TPA: BON domain-containing protein [Chloroflexota bacterium]
MMTYPFATTPGTAGAWAPTTAVGPFVTYCPVCGPTPSWGMAGPGMGVPGWVPSWGPGWVSYTPTVPTYTTAGVPSDTEIRDMVFDALDADPIIPFDADITVEVTGGVVTLHGTVPSKRVKHAAGDDAWWVPGVIDVYNNLEIVGRRERVERPAEAAPPRRPPAITTPITRGRRPTMGR